MKQEFKYLGTLHECLELSKPHHPANLRSIETKRSRKVKLAIRAYIV